MSFALENLAHIHGVVAYVIEQPSWSRVKHQKVGKRIIIQNSTKIHRKSDKYESMPTDGVSRDGYVRQQRSVVPPKRAAGQLVVQICVRPRRVKEPFHSGRCQVKCLRKLVERVSERAREEEEE